MQQDTMSSALPSSSKRGVNVNVKDSPVSDGGNSDKSWEMRQLPPIVHRDPKTQVPYTPRTLAFNTLDRQLPLRAQNEGR